ncbi:MAG: citrate lyase acyl carrier protein [Clostridiales bacterium]|nr:citrate lyase acyl carrier protein [Clostridiales bacterium]
MIIQKNAVAGTLESSDAMIMVEPAEAGEGIDFELDSVVIHQFGNQIRRVTFQTLERLGVKDVHIRVIDKGALDCTLKARIECAVYRSAEISDGLPWGGAIQ